MRSVLARVPFSGPQIWDKGGRLTEMMGVAAWPYEMAIDHEGVVVHTQRGWSLANNDKLSGQVHWAIDKANDAAKERAAR